MEKIIAIILVLICVLGIVGCSQQPQQMQGSQQSQQMQGSQQSQQMQGSQQPQQVRGSQLLAEGNVVDIDVSSLPEGYNYSFSGEDTKGIIDYLSNLNLESNFEENPDDYVGMTWVISLKYESGDTLTLYHFGNFIRSEKGSWYKMAYEEANRFYTLLDELTN